MADRRESIRAGSVTQQVAGQAPVQKTVKVKVLPPRLPPGMAPPTGLCPADAMAWDESIHWRHNESVDADKDKTDSKVTSWRRKAGLTTKRKAAHEKLPPFIFREVPYDV